MLLRISMVLVLSFVSGVAAAAWEDDFLILKNRAVSFEPAGAICEELGKIKYEKTLSDPQLEVITGIEYDDGRMTIGELDLLVYNHATQLFETVIEVKCWRSFKGGLEKARDQRKRFLTHLHSKKPMNLVDTNTQKRYPREAFLKITKFATLGPMGSIEEGYDDELDYSFRELNKFRGLMLDCQLHGDCAKPE